MIPRNFSTRYTYKFRAGSERDLPRVKRHRGLFTMAGENQVEAWLGAAAVRKKKTVSRAVKGSKTKFGPFIL